MEKYTYKSAVELARLIKTGKATSSDIVKEHLERIKKYNHKLNALISVFEEEALMDAEACDRETKEGKFRGPLHGVPVTIKEQFWIKNKKSNINFNMLKDFVAPEDAVVVNRIRKAGAVILGQTNVPRNLLDYQVSGDIYPEGKNPYKTDYSPGGSTGGGAAALAAGFTPLELGGDFGGSIRVPANFCGLFGLKPTERTVPLHGNIPLPKDAKTFLVLMAQSGPLARSIDDIELMWKIITGPHESDRNIPDINWKPPVKNSLSEYKIAWTDGWPGFETSTLTSSSIKTLADNLKANNCHIEKKIPDDTIHRDSLITFTGIFPYVVAQGTNGFVRKLMKMQLYAGLFKGVKKELPYLAGQLNSAFKMNANHFGEMILKRNLLINRWENFFKDFDFLICPVAFGPAYKRCKLGAKLSYEGKEMIYIKYVLPYVACFNASGNPCVTIPLKLSPEGLPIGVQIVGKYWSEPELLNFAKKIDTLTNGFVKPVDFEIN